MQRETELTHPVGEFCTHVETVIPMEVTLREAIQALRKKKIEQKIVYFYVVDNTGKLQGVLSTRQMLLSDPELPIQQIMQDKIQKLKAHETVRDALELFNQHPFLAIPVVDSEGKLLGALDVQSVVKHSVDCNDSAARFDLFQMVGFRLEENNQIPLHRSFRLRMPWLLCNVFAGLVCAIVSRLYEAVLAKVLLLAFFIPLVLTLSESSSMQSMTQSLQFLRRPRFDWPTALKRGLREWQVVSLLALSCGLIVGSLSLLWGDGWLASLTIGAGIAISTAFSALFAISLPVVLHRMKLDPKVASGPVVLMIADILTTAIYLSLATWWLL